MTPEMIAMTTERHARLQELERRALALRRELPPSGADADARNIDNAEGMRRIWEAGFFSYYLPSAHGGIADASPARFTEAFFDLLVNVVAGDSAAGMNFVVQSLVTLEIFDPENGLAASTKDAIAARIKDSGVRLVASNAETGSKRPVTARRVPGGLIVNGVKTFNSNSGGGGIANVAVAQVDGESGRWHALIPLDQPSVVCRHDWDAMGQRGTHSQTIDYDDVFVPDGYSYRSPGLAGAFLPFVFLTHAAILLGIGYGAFDAALDFTRKLDRPTLPEFSSASADPLLRRRIGEFAVDLEGARAYLLRCASRVSSMNEAHAELDPAELAVESMAVKVACARAALTVTQGIFDLTGARGIANQYRFDRFWRNARAISTHDSLDAKEVWVGDWYLGGKKPPMVAALRG